jgi:hypothetical protein
MPIPRGARQVPGSPNRVELSDGRVVTRSTARTLGAQDMGYKNERERGRLGKGDDKYFARWVGTDQGKRAVEKAQARARADGIAYKPGDLKIQLIGARNSAPTSKKGPGPKWLAFMAEYDFAEREIDY